MGKYLIHYKERSIKDLTPFLFLVVSLEFASGLVSGGGSIRWEGTYVYKNEQLCLNIDMLRVPKHVAILEEFYSDFGVGYAIELENAVFGDYTISRTPILFRTFIGDSPPSHIQKCFQIIPVKYSGSIPFKIAGEWEGQYPENKTKFTMRLLQMNNKFNGSMISFIKNKKKISKIRTQIEGWIINGKVTFVEKNEKDFFSYSYVAPYSSSNMKKLSGYYYYGLRKGSWTMTYKSDFEGSPDDILSPDFTNPP